jgi:pimeloyl-ACP methyl ester carboxylesterase
MDGVNGLSMHVLEAGDPQDPLLLLLHGFPELAFSWRHLLGPLAAAGYHVVAPDQRGFGRTTGQDVGHDVDLAPFRMIGLATDMVALIAALGHRRAAAVIGHDFGSIVADWCALARPDLFAAVTMMSAPFTGPPPLNRGSAPDIHAALAALPQPRQHYTAWFSTPAANADMMDAAQGLAAFLAAYYHVKSGDWPGNAPHPLAGWNAEALAVMPRYYIMDLGHGMAETVAPFGPERQPAWLTEDELAVYAAEFGRTGFQGGLNWYRARQPEQVQAERLFAGRRIEVPAQFIAGARDWGVHQAPGGLEAMARLCRQFGAVHLIEGAGHWVQQARPDAVLAALLPFLAAAR